MLPLTPPATAAEPGYPVRRSLLADPALRRRAAAVLAALALGGCGTEAKPEVPLGGVCPVPAPPPAPPPATPPGSQPTTTADDDPVEVADPPEAMIAIAGGLGAPVQPWPQHIRGDAAVPEPPTLVMGEMVAPEPPPPIELTPEPPRPSQDD